MTQRLLERVRKTCLALPGASERVSHGEPTWFVGGKVFVMYANNHHQDGHVAVWLPVPQGMQAALIEQDTGIYFKPPYVGVKGWVGVELRQIKPADLAFHIRTAWSLIAPSRLRAGAAAKPTT